MTDQQSLQHILALLKSGEDVRNAKVRRLKAALKSRRYENDLKLSIAADRLLKDL